MPCMHKCTCLKCAQMCSKCPICRQLAVSWKKVFEAGVVGTADDLAVGDDIQDLAVGDDRQASATSPTFALQEGQRHRDEFSLSDSSDSDGDSGNSVEYLPHPLHQQSGDELQHEHHRPPRQQMFDDEWILYTTYCVQWSEAALVARCGNRLEAKTLLQSMEWKLRGVSSTLNRALARFVSMGFNEMPARVCLLMHNGEEVAALDELLLGRAYVGVAGVHVESVGGF